MPCYDVYFEISQIKASKGRCLASFFPIRGGTGSGGEAGGSERGSGAGRAGAAALGASDAVAGLSGRCPAHEQAAGPDRGGAGRRAGAGLGLPCPARARGLTDPPDLQLYYQVLNFGMIVSSALMIWKGLMVVTGSESPIVVVLR